MANKDITSEGIASEGIASEGMSGEGMADGDVASDEEMKRRAAGADEDPSTPDDGEEAGADAPRPEEEEEEEEEKTPSAVDEEGDDDADAAPGSRETKDASEDNFEEDSGEEDAPHVAASADDADDLDADVLNVDDEIGDVEEEDDADRDALDADDAPEGASDDDADDDSDEDDSDGDDDSDELDAATRKELMKRYEDARRKRMRLLRNYKIQEVIKRRQILLIQVVKEERGNKGAALTTYLSLAGRYCVLMPNTARGGGISRKIPNASDRKRLRKVVDGLDAPKGMGLIIRTAGAKRTKAEIKRDYDYLARLWETIRGQTLKSIAPALIYEEASLIKRAIRDLYDKDIDEILVHGEAGYREAKDFMKMLMP
ncbi:MAG: ribonuclease E/G, partial [Okeania sp. SIO3C4]|nr:ribonuclease E/G [Okeania sp. SIO3C4]